MHFAIIEHIFYSVYDVFFSFKKSMKIRKDGYFPFQTFYTGHVFSGGLTEHKKVQIGNKESYILNCVKSERCFQKRKKKCKIVHVYV